MKDSTERIPWKIRLERRLASYRRRSWRKPKPIFWLDALLFLISLGIAVLVYHQVIVGYLKKFDPNSVLSNLLVINGVFSAVLMTFLFSRIGWTKERKLEAYKEEMDLSQKITDFRRILFVLTRYYNVWDDDKKTKSLLDHGKYSSIEFWELRGMYSGNNPAERERLVHE